MTDRLSEIAQRLEAAAPAPWRFCGCGKCGLIWSIPVDCVVASAQTAADQQGEGPTPEARAHNAELIAHAPDDLRWLLSEVSRLQNNVAFLQRETAAWEVEVSRLQQENQPEYIAGLKAANDGLARNVEDLLALLKNFGIENPLFSALRSAPKEEAR